jgi:hypothetical protein
VAAMWESAEKLLLMHEQESTLNLWVRAQHTPQSVVARCRIILMAAEGLSNNQIAKRLGVSRPTVILWRERFVRGGPSSMTAIEKGRGRKPSIPPDEVQRIIDATLHSKPKGATHWSCRTMAEHYGASAATVQPSVMLTGCSPIECASLSCRGILNSCRN